MKRCLITGASGFVGNNLARRLLTEGHETHLLLRPEYSDWRIRDIRSDVTIHVVDLTDASALTRIVKKIRPEWVFHLAAGGAYSWQTDLRQMLDTNVLGIANLLQACSETDFEAFVNAGSSSEYGFKDQAPSERTWLEPNSHYAVTKASASLLCRYTAQSLNKRIVSLRLYSVYGPYEEPKRLMPALILNGLKDRWPPLVDPTIARDYVYVDDVVRAFIIAASKENQDPGEVYNIGTGVQASLSQVAETARKELGISREPEWGTMQNRIWDTSTWVCDNRHAEDVLGWRPEYDFPTGFKKMADWFRDNPTLRQEYEAELSGGCPTLTKTNLPA
jgi:nucleoside-diphosphate-sugar epimerase